MESMGTNVLYVLPQAGQGVGGVRICTEDAAPDIEAIGQEVPLVLAALPVVNATGQLTFGNQNWSGRI
jgi:hypothetical protein